VAVRDAFGSKNLRGQIFLTGDEFKYAPEKRLNGQSEVFYFTAKKYFILLLMKTPRSLQTVH